jgi:hypothetical protein
MTDTVRHVAMMSHTIDQELPRVSNVVYDEMHVDLSSQRSRELFLQRSAAAAERFWTQMCNGRFKQKYRGDTP